LPLYKGHRVIESVLNVCLGLYNKPKAEVHPGYKLTGSKEEEEVVFLTSLHCTFMVQCFTCIGVGSLESGKLQDCRHRCM